MKMGIISGEKRWRGGDKLRPRPLVAALIAGPYIKASMADAAIRTAVMPIFRKFAGEKVVMIAALKTSRGAGGDARFTAARYRRSLSPPALCTVIAGYITLRG